MKPPPYPLQAVLVQRQAAKDGARHRLAEALREVARAEEALQERRKARDAHRADAEERRSTLYEPDAGGSLSMPAVNQRTEALRYVEDQVNQASRAVEEQEQVLARAESTVSECRGALLDADRELRVVEKNHEAWLEEWKREAARSEQREAEEVVTARYAAERSGLDAGDEP
jgi:flagellar biosynthesis chaperone FliJ